MPSSRPTTPSARPLEPCGWVWALLLVALGLQGIIAQNFTIIWAPVPRDVPHRGLLVYACSVASLATGLGLLTRGWAKPAARVFLALLLGWWVWLRVLPLIATPRSQMVWSGWAETTVFLAAAWIVALALADSPVTGRLGRMLYGGALIPFGTAHFVYLNGTVGLIPAWLPLPTYWAYFTGATFIAAGVAILTTLAARFAAILSVLQLGLFTLLVWLPILARGHADAYSWSETVLSAALTIAAWVVADSYRPKAVPAAARPG